MSNNIAPYKEKVMAWSNPDDLAKSLKINEKDHFFYLRSCNDNSFSYIAINLIDSYVGSSLQFGLEKLLTAKNAENFIFSILPYESMIEIDSSYDIASNFYINNGQIKLYKFSVIFAFDHYNRILKCHYLSENDIPNLIIDDNKNCQISIDEIYSNFTDEDYKDAIQKVRESIAAGDYYQTNLTRKFFGKLNKKPDPSNCLELFIDLCKKSPANYSCFTKDNGNITLCNSPELYLNLKDGQVESRPIKGTIARSRWPFDYFKRQKLKNSTKDKSENLMIVDLVRNDLSLVSKPGSIEVDNLFKLSTYSSYHHLSSSVKGSLEKDRTIIDLYNASFPPGSMTGAPKIAAVNAANKLENIQRGIYSGSIGIIQNYHNAILNVVIRTLIIDNDKYEFQVGGAIIFDSQPSKELEEIFVKAKPICNLLNIKSLKNVSRPVF